ILAEALWVIFYSKEQMSGKIKGHRLQIFKPLKQKNDHFQFPCLLFHPSFDQTLLEAMDRKAIHGRIMAHF
ncbi:hypothetical protein, partial [Heyndrickxia coagulans]